MTTLTEPRTVADLRFVANETGELSTHWARIGQWRLDFRNGWSISIGFGPTYGCDNQGMLTLEESMATFPAEAWRNVPWERSTTAEVMVIKPDGDRMIWPHNEDGILGFEPVASVAALIRLVAKEGQV